MGILITALLMGLTGSLHCIGMCGPIALSLPLRGNNFTQKITAGLLYNLGRTTTYSMMGAFFGLIGQSFNMLGFQQWISIIMGSFMTASIILPSIFKNRLKVNLNFLLVPLRHAIQRLFKVRSYKGLFLVGMGNGLLPCGLVYLAIAGAIGVGSFYLGIAFMLIFGLGTIPLMLMISWVGNVLTTSVRNKMNKVIPYLVVVIGIIFILRGLTLGIPYLSPPKEKLTPVSHMSASPVKATDALKHPCCQPNSAGSQIKNAK